MVIPSLIASIALIGGIFLGKSVLKEYVDSKRIWAAIDEISKEKSN